MLPKVNRIDKKLFKEISPRGRSFHSGPISLKISPTQKGNIRFAFVVSAKTAKKAVARNKLRRRARGIVAKLLPSFKENLFAGKHGIAVIIFFKKGSEKLDFAELEKKIITIFKKAKILV